MVGGKGVAVHGEAGWNLHFFGEIRIAHSTVAQDHLLLL